MANLATPAASVYFHNGIGAPIRAPSAARAAKILARRLYGCQGSAESLHFSARTYHYEPGEHGLGEIGGKMWTAMLVMKPDKRQKYTGKDYVRQCREVRLLQGSVAKTDVPGGKYPARPVDLLAGNEDKYPSWLKVR